MNNFYLIVSFIIIIGKINAKNKIFLTLVNNYEGYKYFIQIYLLNVL